MLIFLKFNHNKDKEINEITSYIEEINKKNYKLKIDDNSEDELSILKNEIYKTTIMLKEQAENLSKDKIDLKNSLSDISHQLKTPLTSIIIMLDNILENENMDNNIRQDFIKDIKREITNITFLVQNILKLSKLDTNTVEFFKDDIYLEDIIKECLKNLGALCDLRNISIEVKQSNHPKIFADFKWQVEALTNIIKNCIEHSKDNSKIDININDNKLYAQISIKDYGSGIDSKDLKNIFKRFYRGTNASKDSVGIGLALAKSIIESNNGKIEVESKVDEGTTFIIKYY